jgi:8-oxo-dGTP pyrophosphatase MutT (NUDIX family)
LFPTFYEGFGLPILEAQNVGTPVVTSNVSSLPETGGDAAAYCDPNEPAMIAEAAHKILEDEKYKKDLIEKGYKNAQKFSWEKCAERETFEEAGIKIKNIRFGAVTNDIAETEGKHVITIHLVADYDSGDPKLMEPEKCFEWGWFDKNHLPEPLFLCVKNYLLKYKL